MLNKNQIAHVFKLTKKMIEEITGEQTPVRVTAGSAMVMHGVRPLSNDVDCTVSTATMKKLISFYQTNKDDLPTWKLSKNGSTDVLYIDHADIVGEDIPDTDAEMLDVNGQIVEVYTLQALIAFKERLLGLDWRTEAKKAQDQKDIAALKAHQTA
jgi:outer membrane protein assembly factor BamB